jgi:hypothetical protein
MTNDSLRRKWCDRAHAGNLTDQPDILPAMGWAPTSDSLPAHRPVRTRPIEPVRIRIERTEPGAGERAGIAIEACSYQPRPGPSSPRARWPYFSRGPRSTSRNQSGRGGPQPQRYSPLIASVTRSTVHSAKPGVKSCSVDTSADSVTAGGSRPTNL